MYCCGESCLVLSYRASKKGFFVSVRTSREMDECCVRVGQKIALLSLPFLCNNFTAWNYKRQMSSWNQLLYFYAKDGFCQKTAVSLHINTASPHPPELQIDCCLRCLDLGLIQIAHGIYHACPQRLYTSAWYLTVPCSIRTVGLPWPLPTRAYSQSIRKCSHFQL